MIETRRKHRWVFETLGRGAGTFSQAELLLLKAASRPKFKYKQVEMNHNQEVARFAGPQSFEPISLSWYDGQQNPDVSKGIYVWIETVTNMHSIKVAAPTFYKRTGSLSMIDGAGLVDENWTLYGSWPSDVDWGKLEYTSADIQSIDVTLCYDRAIRNCVNAAAPQPVVPNCV